jgi:hypothetical protein
MLSRYFTTGSPTGDTTCFGVWGERTELAHASPHTRKPSPNRTLPSLSMHHIIRLIRFFCACRYNEQETLALALGRAVETFLFEEKKFTVASKQTVVELEVRQPAILCRWLNVSTLTTFTCCST